MEQWEIEARERLSKEVPDGMYTIGEGKWKAITGKGGYINYHIELMRYTKENYKDLIIQESTEPTGITAQEIIDEVRRIYFNKADDGNA